MRLSRCPFLFFAGWYGAFNTDANFTAKTPAYVWTLLNQYVSGSIVTSGAWPSWDLLSVFSAYDSSAPVGGQSSVVLMNRAGVPLQVSFSVAGWPTGSAPPANSPVRTFLVDANGLAPTGATVGGLLASGVQMTADSVIVLVW